MGHPTSPFIGEEKARVTAEENEKNEREKKASRVTGSFFSCKYQQGWLHVAALFITGTMRRHHLPVMTFHSIPTDVVVN